MAQAKFDYNYTRNIWNWYFHFLYNRNINRIKFMLQHNHFSQDRTVYLIYALLCSTLFHSTEAEFLDVIGTKVLRVSSLLFTVSSTNGFYSPPPPLEQQCMACNVNTVY